jgi:hypothetical protein
VLCWCLLSLYSSPARFPCLRTISTRKSREPSPNTSKTIYPFSRPLRSDRRVIGTPTGGGCGIPVLFDITEAITLRLSTRIITDPVGNHTERGITPDVEVIMTSNQLGSGRRIYAPDDAEALDVHNDLILKKAVETLSGGLS